jgi:hypothetical protein
MLCYSLFAKILVISFTEELSREMGLKSLTLLASATLGMMVI